MEDNAGDIRLVQERLKESSLRIELRVVRNGVEAMNYLRRWGAYARASPPDLVLLDLNLPRMDGRRVLAEVRGDPELNRIPVVVLTSSPAEEDVQLASSFHAEGYIRKPLELPAFHALLSRLELPS